MKILYFAFAELVLKEGHAVHTAHMSNALVEAGADVCLVVPSFAEPPVIPLKARLVKVPFYGYGPVRTPYFEWQAKRVIQQLLKRETFDLIIEKEHSFSTLMTAAKAHGIPYVVEVNGMFWRDHSWNAKVERIQTRKMAALDGMLCFSHEIKKVFMERYGVPSKKIQVLPNGVDLSHFESKESWSTGEGSFRLCFPGGINPRYDFKKMAAIFLKARQLNPQLEFHVAGLAAQASPWPELATQKGQGIFTHGLLSPEEVASFFMKQDALYMLMEADCDDAVFSAMKVIEAQAVGLPVVMNGRPEGSLGQGVTWIPNSLDEQQSAKILADLPHNYDVEDVKRSRQHVRQSHAWSKVADETLHFLESHVLGVTTDG